jgi:hypothetical protein
VTTGAAAARSVALDAYIARRERQGFRVETRRDLLAVIVRRRPLYFLLRRVPRVAAEERFVLSVNEDGDVTKLAAQPRQAGTSL